MSLLAVIPARLGAQRLPRKPLRLLGGEPLIVRVWQRAVATTVADRCVVATDSDAVLAAVRAAGGEAVLTRSNHPSGTDRVAEVAAADEFRSYDVVVNIQGDEPFASADAIRAATAVVASGRFPLGTVACPAPTAALEQPDVVKVVTDDAGRALYFSRAAIPHLRDAESADDRATREALVRRHVGIYAYTRDALARWVALPPHPLELVERLEQLRPLAHGIAMGVADIAHAPEPGIDTEDDLARANAAWAAQTAAPDATARLARDTPRPTTAAAAHGSAS
jgi:3-deoxy-manno-octulosonate cytidylyltransferase (CMP-KDO synthetase)